MFLYRYWTHVNNRTDAPTVNVELDQLKVDRETPSGYWYFKASGAYCWVSKSKKGNRYPRYCYANKADAWASYLIRVAGRIKHLKYQSHVANAAERLVKNGRKSAEKPQTTIKLYSQQGDYFDVGFNA